MELHRTLPRPRAEQARLFVVGMLCLIGLFDVVSGLWMLLGHTPWLQNGQGGAWLSLPTDVQLRLADGPIALGLYRRIGAFWLHAGLVTLAWTWWVRDDWRGRTLLLATYCISGIGLGWCDNTFAAGTPWLMLKQGVGAVWVVGLVVHWYGRPRAPVTR
jgi:hypothetical protein